MAWGKHEEFKSEEIARVAAGKTGSAGKDHKEASPKESVATDAKRKPAPDND